MNFTQAIPEFPNCAFGDDSRFNAFLPKWEKLLPGQRQNYQTHQEAGIGRSDKGLAPGCPGLTPQT